MVTSLKKKKILDRWAEYISELFEDHRKDCNVKKRNYFSDPPIMKDEVQAAMRKMKLAKQETQAVYQWKF